MKCKICGTESPLWAWTDTHGIAQCECGVPYRLLHYDENNERIYGKEPECIVRDKWIKPLQDYWKEYRRTIPSGCSFPGGQERATPVDIAHYNKHIKRPEEQAK